MRTRRDQVQAYRFLTRRIVSALLVGEPETSELPMRRFALAVLGGVTVAALVFAGAGVYGLLVPGGRRPVENAIILERETGAKYLYLQGLLHPVLNWTSARLILGQQKPPVRSMSQSSLRAVPRGRPVGIAGAPDALPVKSALLGLPWSVCSAPRSASTVALATQVVVGHVPPGGTPPGTDEGLLVGTAEGTRYLVWRDRRLRVPDNATLAALEWSGVRPVPVADAFLNALPAGPDLAVAAVPDAGAPAPDRIAGVGETIGQLFRVAGQHYVVLREGLAPVGPVYARLAPAGGPVTEISAQDAGRALVGTAVEPPGFPAEVPDVRTRAGQAAMVCAGYHAVPAAVSADAQQVAVQTYPRFDDELALAAGQGTAPRQGADGVLTADRVAMPGGHAALVRALPPPGASAPGNVYLVTDQGIKYPLPAGDTDKVQLSLGYAGVRPAAIPGPILALVPTGPALDPAAAVLLAPPAAVTPPTPGQ